jgi:hypothetical protein
VAHRISTLFGIPPDVFERTGALDAFVDVDSRLYVDPHLLEHSRCPELAGSHDVIRLYFDDLARILQSSQAPDDVFWRSARTRLTFHELEATGLGISSRGTGGRGIGRGLAAEVTNTAKQIIDAGVRDAKIFELIGLFQEDIGPDRISDMTVRIILPHLLAFSARVARDLGLPTYAFRHDGRDYGLPFIQARRRSLVLVPTDVLRPILVANSWDEVDVVASHNAALRHAVNQTIGDTWKQATRISHVGKDLLLATALQHPGLFEDLLTRYRAKDAKAYDFAADPEALIAWHALTRGLATEFPLPGDLAPRGRTFDELSAVVDAIVENFKRLIEMHRLGRLLYNDDGSPRREKAAQLTFFGLADAYCSSNDFDISPESDGGSGPVDFKFSQGHDAKVVVEMKLSSNSSLLHGYQRQLPAYATAERAHRSIYLVVKNGNHDRRIDTVLTARRDAVARGDRAPDIVVVDARPQAAATRQHRRRH